MSSDETLPLTAVARREAGDSSYRAADRNSGINYPFEDSTTATRTTESGREKYNTENVL